jgi:hypothetical protein
MISPISTEYFSYQEWWRDWPDETRQPIDPIDQYGANSCGICILRDESRRYNRSPFISLR